MLVSCLALWKWSTSPVYFLEKFCPLRPRGGGTPLEDFSVARVFYLVLNLNMIHRLKPRPARTQNIISRVGNSFWEKRSVVWTSPGGVGENPHCIRERQRHISWDNLPRLFPPKKCSHLKHKLRCRRHHLYNTWTGWTYVFKLENFRGKVVWYSRYWGVHFPHHETWIGPISKLAFETNMCQKITWNIHTWSSKTRLRLWANWQFTFLLQTVWNW